MTTQSNPNSNITIRGGSLLQLGALSVRFQRTLRIPDDGRDYPLPPGLGAFPLRRVSDYAGRVPDGWAEKGGVFLPMYQREAMWLSFSGARRALKVGVGKVCAISGERWREGLVSKPQNYVVTGTQPWLDGIASGKGTIRQFVAMPLGMGYTVEAQVTGEERHGGIQLQVYEPKPGRLPPPRRRYRSAVVPQGFAGGPPPCAPAPCSPAPGAGTMGIAAGGSMVQKIYPDPHGVDTWNLGDRTRVFVHIVNSELWREITGESPPASPVTAKAYAQAGLPWFDLYDEGAPTISPTAVLGQVKSVKQLDHEKFDAVIQDDASVQTSSVKKIVHVGVAGVTDGDW